MKRLAIIVATLAALPMTSCTSDATGPEGALEQALSRARAPAPADETRAPAQATRTLARLALSFSQAASGAGGTVLPTSLTIERRIDEGGGRFRLSDVRVVRAPSVADPSRAEERKDGVESVFDGRQMATRRGDGPWIERDTLDGLPARTLGGALDLGDFVVTAFGDYLRLTPLDPSESRPAAVGGRPVQWLAVALDPAVRPRALAESELAALRDHVASEPLWVAATHRPTRVSGELARTREGNIVAGHLALDGETPLPDGPGRFALELSIEVSPLPADAAFALPDERLPEVRERPWLMIEDVLGDDLLPPYKGP